MDGHVRVAGLVEFTRSELEIRAADFLRRRPDVKRTAPIDVELLLEYSGNVRLEIMAGLLNRFGVEGCVCNQFMSRQMTVFVDQNIANRSDDARYNAVVAEELAHIQLHRALIEQVEDVEDFLAVRSHPAWRRIEADARYYSAALRMPSDLLSRHAETVYPLIVDAHGFGDHQHVQKAVCSQLALTFLVPTRDMQSRMSQWPCELNKRITASLHGGSIELLPADSVHVREPESEAFRQRTFLMP